MDSIFPKADFPSEPKEPSGLGAFRWVVLGLIIVATGVGLLIWLNSVRRDRAEAVAHSQETPTQEGCPLIGFTDKDVVVNHGWTFLTGRHPSVTFSCRLSPALPPTKFAILCYRPLGTAEWNSAETHPRRDNTCRLTLRDLHRDMLYECFFIAYSKDTAIESKRVSFSTGQPTRQ